MHLRGGRPFLRNLAWLTSAFLFGRGASLFWQLLLARFLSDRAEIYGQLGVLISSAAIFVVVIDFSLNFVAQQEWPRAQLNTQELFGLIAILRGGTGILGALAFIGAIYFTYGESEMFYASLPFGVSLFVTGQTQTPIAVWESRQEMGRCAFLGLLQTALVISFQSLALLFVPGLLALSIAVALASLLSTLVTWVMAVRHFGPPRLLPSSALTVFARNYLALAFPLMAASIVFVLYFRIDAILLSQTEGDTAAGVFVLATMLYLGFTDLTWSQFGKAAFPVIAQEWHKPDGRDELYRRLGVINDLFLIVGLLAFVSVISLGPVGAQVVLGSDSPWRHCWQPLVILLAGYWPLTVFSLLYRVLLLDSKGVWYMIAVTTATLLKACIFFILVPKLSFNGAALANCICQYLMTGLLLVGLTERRRCLSNSSIVCYSLALTSSILLAWAVFSWPWATQLVLQLIVLAGILLTLMRQRLGTLFSLGRSFFTPVTVNEP